MTVFFVLVTWFPNLVVTLKLWMGLECSKYSNMDDNYNLTGKARISTLLHWSIDNREDFSFSHHSVLSHPFLHHGSLLLILLSPRTFCTNKLPLFILYCTFVNLFCNVQDSQDIVKRHHFCMHCVSFMSPSLL